MAGIGKFVLGLASGEASFSLANVNFDFSIVRMDPPAEYIGLGNHLSRKRKRAAEEGSLHTTARKLGALFIDDLPSVPHLTKAYGLRVSEIAADPKLNPAGSSLDGALEGFIGADGTSIWAAATSGPGALQVHLLACMLARIWSGPEAVSIWSELVAARKKVLQHKLQEGAMHINTITAAQIDVPRDQFTQWDSSARSWLLTADKAKRLQQTQLMLIIENSGLALPSRPDVYHTVMNAWTTAMSIVDRLVSGQALSAQSPEVFLGLSAWHLYPNMTVLGTKTTTVNQEDEIVSPGGHITIGLQKKIDENEPGVHWSMPLCHLRYYGRPVVTEKYIGSSTMRAPFRRFLQIVLGGVIADWRDRYSSIDEVYEFLLVLKHLVLPHEDTSDQPPRNWLALLDREGGEYAKESEIDRQESARHISLGSRRYRSFVGDDHPSPFFGLGDIKTLLNLMTVEDQIKAIREIALDRSLDGNLDNAIIRYSPHKNISRREYATVSPQTFRGISRKLHRRWIQSPTRQNASFDYVRPAAEMVCVVAVRSLQLMAQTRELCGFLNDNEIVSRCSTPMEYLQWDNVKSGIDLDSLHKLLVHQDENYLKDQRLSMWRLAQTSHFFRDKEYHLVFGTQDVQVFCPERPCKQPSLILHAKLMTKLLKMGLVATNTMQRHLGVFINQEPLELEARRFEDHYRLPTNHNRTPYNQDAPLRLSKDHPQYMQTLYAIYSVSLTYHHMHNAEINLNVLSLPLYKAKWAADASSATETNISISQAFACVAMLDSGFVNLAPQDCKDVMAVSSGNSLYVSSLLLNDPCNMSDHKIIRHRIGNVGRPGLVLLLSNRNPDIGEPSLETWRMVNHSRYNGKVEDNFQSISLQLGLTGYEMPLNIHNPGLIDSEAFYVEAVVSVHDHGTWVADIDVLKLPKNRFAELPTPCTHSGSECDDFSRLGHLVSIDCWAELQDRPSDRAVIRAYRNWQARLAMAAILVERGDNNVIFADKICWQCAALYVDPWLGKDETVFFLS